MDSYNLSRNFFDWCFENPEKIKPSHTAIYFFAIEHCNRLGWKEKFGFPTQMVMDAVGIKKHQTYIEYFNDLVEWGFFKLVQKSFNQYSANIICLQNALPKTDKALDKAIIKHRAKQVATTGQSKGQSKDSINKPVYKEPINQLTTPESDSLPVEEKSKIDFEEFWNLYDKKVGDKLKLKKKWDSFSRALQETILNHVAAYKAATNDKQYMKNPEAYFNQKTWNDEIINRNTTVVPVLPDGTKPYNQYEDMERQRQAWLIKQQQQRLQSEKLTA